MDYPIGVALYKHTGKYHAKCKNPFTGKQEHLGLFSTPEEAHEAWRKRKHELSQLVAATESDPRVVEALKSVIHLRSGINEQNIDTCRRYDSNQGNLRVARYFENFTGSDI